MLYLPPTVKVPGAFGFREGRLTTISYFLIDLPHLGHFRSFRPSAIILYSIICPYSYLHLFELLDQIVELVLGFVGRFLGPAYIAY
jgi:hypothetical protein